MPTNTPIFNIPKPVSSDIFLLSNFNAILDAIESGVSGRVQMAKSTDDTGGVKINLSNTTDDILASLLALGKGIHTFYAISGSVNNPGNGSIRGMAHFTAANTGWVHATDTNNNVYTNYCDLGTWKGWNKHVTDKAPSFTNLTLQNGAAVNLSRTPKFTKQGNAIFIEGEIQNITAGTVIATLPVGSRPGYGTVFPTAQNTGSAVQHATIFIDDTNGQISVLQKDGNFAISLNGINFIAEK